MISPTSQGAPTSAGLRRDMELLRELSSDECLRRGGLGVVRIAVRLGRDKSQVSRALRALQGEGLVQRDPRTRTYQLGWGLYTLAARGIETRLVRAAATHLHQLAGEQQADVRLCVLIRGQVLTLTSLPNEWAAGAEAPTRTPAGAVLALDWPDAALGNLFAGGDLAHTGLLDSREQARVRGYVQFHETDTEPARYAAPVRDFRGVVLAAIQLTQRPGEESATHRAGPGKALVDAANSLSADLGIDS
ncbi:MAG: helix-turn-helix domain-containing protein [Dermatophilaceae bacterium]|nr:helix-turn-helix domain-containing protein [Dermatophilaceae bacterium]